MEANWQNVTDPIFHYARLRPDAPALIEGMRTVTYRELAALVAKATVYHANLGIAPGQRVAVALVNSIDHFVLSLGLLRLGARLMEMPYAGQDAPAAGLLAKFGIGTIFIERGTALPVGARAIVVDPATWRANVARLEGDRRYDGSGDQIYTITLSSGTTGTAKGKLTSHRQYFLRHKALTELYADSNVFSAAKPAACLVVGSIAYSVFFRLLLTQLTNGASAIVMPTSISAIDLIRAIAALDDAVCYLTAAICPTILAFAPEPGRGVLFPRLRALVAGTGPLQPHEKLAMLDRVTPNFYYGYGASGFGHVALLPPAMIRRKPQSAGRPASFVDLQVVDRADKPAPTGTVGRIRCRGSESKGFAVADDEQGDEGFRDGWYYPGDVGYLDEDGYIFLKGRTVDLIQRAGGEVFASEIDAVIALHPSVREVAAIGLPRAAGGAVEEIVAIVVPRGEAQHEALAQHCRTQLPPDRQPDRIVYAQALPKTAAGKLDRARIRALASREAPGGSSPLSRES